jgi:hypothetical protein
MGHSLAKYAHNLEGRLAKMKEKGEEAMAHGLQLAEVAGASAAAGYANAKFGTNGELLVKGVPADLLGGIGLHALAFLGAAGKYGEHAHNLGDGLIAAYAYRAGVHAGT